MNDTTQDNPITQAAQVDMIPGPSKPFGVALDFTKPLRTKHSKTPATVIAIVHQFKKPVLVALGSESALSDQVIEYALDGRHGGGGCLDLENYTPATEIAK